MPRRRNMLSCVHVFVQGSSIIEGKVYCMKYHHLLHKIGKEDTPAARKTNRVEECNEVDRGKEGGGARSDGGDGGHAIREVERKRKGMWGLKMRRRGKRGKEWRVFFVWRTKFDRFSRVLMFTNSLCNLQFDSPSPSSSSPLSCASVRVARAANFSSSVT